MDNLQDQDAVILEELLLPWSDASVDQADLRASRDLLQTSIDRAIAHRLSRSSDLALGLYQQLLRERQYPRDWPGFDELLAQEAEKEERQADEEEDGGGVGSGGGLVSQRTSSTKDDDQPAVKRAPSPAKAGLKEAADIETPGQAFLSSCAEDQPVRELECEFIACMAARASEKGAEPVSPEQFAAVRSAWAMVAAETNENPTFLKLRDRWASKVSMPATEDVLWIASFLEKQWEPYRKIKAEEKDDVASAAPKEESKDILPDPSTPPRLWDDLPGICPEDMLTLFPTTILTCDACKRQLPSGCYYESLRAPPRLRFCDNCFSTGKLGGFAAGGFVLVDPPASERVREGAVIDNWTDDELLRLLDAITHFQPTVQSGWDAVAQYVGTKSANECLKRFLTLGPAEYEDDPRLFACDLPFTDTPNPILANVHYLAGNVNPGLAAAFARGALTAMATAVIKRENGEDFADPHFKDVDVLELGAGAALICSENRPKTENGHPFSEDESADVPLAEGSNGRSWCPIPMEDVVRAGLAEVKRIVMLLAAAECVHAEEQMHRSMEQTVDTIEQNAAAMEQEQRRLCDEVRRLEVEHRSLLEQHQELVNTAAKR